MYCSAFPVLRLPGHTFFVLGRMSADGRVGLEAPDHAKAADRGSREDLSFWLAEIFHLLPGALLMGGVLVLAPSLIERGVPYEIAHIASALLTMVPFMFGAMFLYGRIRHGHLTLRGVVRFRRHMPL
jgi:hypothetical protein